MYRHMHYGMVRRRSAITPAPPAPKKRKFHIEQVQYNSASTTGISKEILDQIEHAQNRGKRRIVLKQTHEHAVSSLQKAGFGVQKLTKADDTVLYIVHWTRGMVMFTSA